MELEIKQVIGKALPAKRAVTSWKESPGDFTLACVAARYYAYKLKEPMVVIPGNSYMHRVFHIAKASASVRKFTVNKEPVVVGLVDIDGTVRRAVAS